LHLDEFRFIERSLYRRGAARGRGADRGPRPARPALAQRAGRRYHVFALAQLQRPVREVAGLSLVAGVAVARALRALGVAQAALKWPNDLVVSGAKLGGILVETRSQGRATHAVIASASTAGMTSVLNFACAARWGRWINSSRK